MLRFSAVRPGGNEHYKVDPVGETRVVRDGGAAAPIDGGSWLAPIVATEALARADEYGDGAVGVHSGSHLGMLGYYTFRRDRYVSKAVTDTEPSVAPFGGAAPILGTNPFAIVLPIDPPFNLDRSTSAISRGEVYAVKQ